MFLVTKITRIVYTGKEIWQIAADQHLKRQQSPSGHTNTSTAHSPECACIRVTGARPPQKASPTSLRQHLGHDVNLVDV